MFQEIKNIYHLFQAVLANIIYGFPSRRLKVIGVTGTDGKTTTTQLIAHIIKTSGKKVSFISTVLANIAGQEYDTGFHVTTPSPFTIQHFLKKSLLNKDDYFVLETTSHALDQNRVWGISFLIGVITNITHEHLDYHGTYQKYVVAKKKLLKMAKTGIINKNDGSYKYLSPIPDGKTKEYNEKIKILDELPTLTEYNRYNYAAAYTVCKQLGISDEIILKAFKTFQLPKGRLDLVYNKNFKIIIDFAHTPNALFQLLPAVRKLYLKKGGRLIHVFGSAGLRDLSKRPLMGEAADRYSDMIFLTEEDYRTEDLKKICEQIATGIKNKRFQIIPNRYDAINKAILSARPNDVVVLTGKSHEKSLCRGTIEYPWDEYAAVAKTIKKL